MIVGGSSQVPGAVILTALAALRSGAGKVQIAVPASIAPIVGAAVIEGRVFAMPETDGSIAPAAATAIVERTQHANALVIGPGIVDRAAITALLSDLLPQLNELPTILDAEALTALKEIDATRIPLGE